MASINRVGVFPGISPETNRHNNSNQDHVSDVANKTFLILNELRGDVAGLLHQIPGDLFPLINQELQNINKPAKMPTGTEMEIADCLGEMRKYWQPPVGALQDQVIFDEIDIKMFAKWASEKRLSHIELPFSDDVEFKKLIPHLTHLTCDRYFSGFDLYNSCLNPPIRETHLKNITHLTNLTSLTIKDCEELTDAGFLNIASFPNLTSLGLLGCKKVQSASLQHFSRLKALKVYSCLTWTNEDCANIKNLTNLTSLDLSESTRVQNTGIQYITGLTKLKVLNLSYCYELTDEAFKEIAKLTNLVSLNLRFCDELTQEGLSDLAAALPQLNCDGRKNLSTAHLYRLWI